MSAATQTTYRAAAAQLTRFLADQFGSSFGVRLGGETGMILAKGTAEVNLKITMTWNRCGAGS